MRSTKMQAKKLLAVLIAVIMVFPQMPITAAGAESIAPQSITDLTGMLYGDNIVCPLEAARIRLLAQDDSPITIGAQVGVPREGTAGAATFEVRTGEAAGVQIIPIAQANAAAVNTEVTVEGFVVGRQAANRLLIQDGFAPYSGIMVATGAVATALDDELEGQWVRVSGNRVTQWGQPEIRIAGNAAPCIEVIPAPDGSEPIVPIAVTLEQLAQSGMPSSFNSMLVSLDAAEILTRNAGINLQNHILQTAAANTAQIVLRAALTNTEGFQNGDMVSVDRAIIHWHSGDSAIQLLPSFARPVGTVTPIAPAVLPVTTNPVCGHEFPVGGGYVTLETETAGAEIRYRINGGDWQTSTANPATVSVSDFINRVAELETYARLGADVSVTRTFTFYEEIVGPAPTIVSVSAQTGAVTAGVAGSVTFTVVTENMAQDTAIQLNSPLPEGVTLNAATVDNSGETVLTVQATANTPAGKHALSLAIGGVMSETFFLRVSPPEPAQGAEVLAVWHFANNTAVSNARISDNRAVPANGGIISPPPSVQFIENRENAPRFPRELSGGSTGINIVNTPAEENALSLLTENNAWWETVISTVGHTDIQVTWRMRSPASGPRDWQLQYSTDAVSWHSVGDPIVLAVGDTSTLNNPERERMLPQSAEEQETLFLRWLLTSTASANGNTIGVVGTTQINDIRITSGVTDDGGDPGPLVITIAEARAADIGEVVTVRGIVTNYYETAANNNNSFFLQDPYSTCENSGIHVRLVTANATVSGESGARAFIGHLVEVTGVRQRPTATNGFQGIDNIMTAGDGHGVTILEEDVPLPPVIPVQLANLTAPAGSPRPFSSAMVSVERVQLLGTTNGAGGNVNLILRGADGNPLSIGGNTFVLGNLYAANFAASGFAAGDWVEIHRANVHWWHGRDEIQLRVIDPATDVVLTTAPDTAPYTAAFTATPAALVLGATFDPHSIPTGTEISLNNTNNITGLTMTPATVHESGITQITVNTTAETPQGSHPLTITIGDVVSDTFYLTVYPPLGAVITIAEARAEALGEVVTVRGIATNYYETTANNNNSFFLQCPYGTCENSGIHVRLVTGNTAITPITNPNGARAFLGHLVEVTGVRQLPTATNGFQGIDNIMTAGDGHGVTIIEENVTLPAVIPVQLVDLTAAADSPRPFSSAMVSVERVQLHGTTTGAGTNQNLVLRGADGNPLSIGGNTFILGNLYVGSFAASGFEAGDWVEIRRANVHWWAARNEIQLRVIDPATDVVLTTPPVADAVISNPPSGASLPAGSDVTLSVASPAAVIVYSVNGGAAQTSATASTVITLDYFPGANNTATITAFAIYNGEETVPQTFTFHQVIPTPIAAVNAAASGTFTVIGYAIATTGTVGNDAGNLWIQEPHGNPLDGILVWGGVGNDLTGYIGYRIMVTGTRGSFNNLNQLTGPVIVRLGSGTPPVTQVSRTSDLAPPNYRFMKVSLERAQFIARANATGTLPPVGTNLIQCPEGTRIELTLAEGEYLPLGLQSGDWIEIEYANVFWNNGRSAVQLVNARVRETTPPPVTEVTASPTTGATVPLGAAITLSAYPAEARIVYSVNGGTQNTSDSATVSVIIDAFSQSGNTAIIEAFSVLPCPDVTSEIIYQTSPRIFVYTQSQVAPIIPSHISGRLRPGTTIALQTATDNAQIYYTITRYPNQLNEYVYPTAPYADGITVTANMFPLRITAAALKAGYLPSEPLTLEFTEREIGGEQVFFGNLHAHTTMSDGMGTPEWAFQEARDYAGLDFFVLSDHSNWFNWGHISGGTGAAASGTDGPEVFNLNDYQIDRWELDNNHVPTTGGTNYQWERGRAAARGAMTPYFLASNGFEFTWAGGPGHINTFNTTGWVCRRNSYLNVSNNDLRLLRYYELLRRTPESISLFAHPGTTFGNFNNFAHFDHETALRIPLVEVANGEGAIGSGGFFPSHEQFILALDRGWLVAPVNSQDNHRGRFGWSNEARTAMYTNDFSYEGMWQAFRDRAVYSTEVRDMEIRFYMNNEPMGSIVHNVPNLAAFSVEAYIPETPRVANNRIPVRDNYVITMLELVTNGGVVAASHTFSTPVPVGETAEHIFEKENPSAGYYFLRVVAVNSRGQERLALTAPVWIGRAPIVGISEVASDTFMPITGEELTLTTHFFNDERIPVTLSSLQMFVGGNLVLTTIPALTILPGETPYINLPHTFTAQGNASINMRAVINVSGEYRFYDGFIDLFVRDGDAVHFVGIDGSHFNEYVDGGQRNSFSNFARLAAEMNFITRIFNTPQELIDATQNERYKIIIMPPPGRAAGIIADPTRGEHRYYSDEVITAVADFALRGGTVAVSGFGNFNDQAGTIPGISGAHSYQQNRLLSAMGSNIRIGDASHTPPVGFRGAFTHQHNLRFSENFNLNNPFMAGVIPAELDPVHIERAEELGLPLGPVSTEQMDFELHGGQLFRNFSTGALYVVNDATRKIRSAADDTNYVVRGGVNLLEEFGVDTMIFAHPASWAVDSNTQQGSGRTKFPLVGNFPRYAHPTYGLAAAPETGGGVGQRAAAGGTEDGQILIGASQNVGEGTVLAFSSIFFSNFDIRPDLDNPLELHNVNYTLVRNMLAPLAPVPPITDISYLRYEAEFGQWFTIEGVVTSGLQITGAGSAENRGFMNSIYIQDETGGINLFEVTENNAAGLQVGQTIRARGYVSQYQGERQLTVHRGGSVQILPRELTVVPPTTMNTAQAKQQLNIGTLARVVGSVSNVITQPGETTLLQFTITDAYGDIYVYMRDYITPGVNLDFVEEGAVVAVTGFASHGELAGGYGHRIRVRDRAEIELVQLVRVTFNPRGGAFEYMGDAGRFIEQGAAIGRLPVAISRTEGGYYYRISGWFTEPNGEGERVTPSFTADGDITLYARWVRRPTGFQVGSVIIGSDTHSQGRVTSADATAIARHIVNPQAPEICPIAADINGDGVVCTIDLVLLSRWLAGHNVQSQIAR